MGTETLIKDELGNYANLLLPAVFSSDIKPELNPENNEWNEGKSYPIMVLLENNDVVTGYYCHKNKFWYIAFDGNGYTATKHDNVILKWRYLSCKENTEYRCNYCS